MVLPVIEPPDVIIEIPIFILNHSNLNIEDVTMNLRYADSISVASTVDDEATLQMLARYESHKYLREATSKMDTTNVVVALNDLHPFQAYHSSESFYLNIENFNTEWSATKPQAILANIGYKISAKNMKSYWGDLDLLITHGTTSQEVIDNVGPALKGKLGSELPRRFHYIRRSVRIFGRKVNLPTWVYARKVPTWTFNEFSLSESKKTYLVFSLRCGFDEGAILF